MFCEFIFAIGASSLYRSDINCSSFTLICVIKAESDKYALLLWLHLTVETTFITSDSQSNR